MVVACQDSKVNTIFGYNKNITFAGFRKGTICYNLEQVAQIWLKENRRTKQ